MGDILSQLEGTDLETLENLGKSRTYIETLEKTGKKKEHKKVISLSENWSGRADSNGRPRRPERRALNQAELRPVCCQSFQVSPFSSLCSINLNPTSFRRVCLVSFVRSKSK